MSSSTDQFMMSFQMHIYTVSSITVTFAYTAQLFLLIYLELQTAFTLLDHDKNGLLSAKDLQAATRMLGMSMPEEYVTRFMKKLGKDGKTIIQIQNYNII